MIRLAICSDLDLEGKFMFMSKKTITKYEKKQLEHLGIWTDSIIKEKPDVVVIVGNLFGKINPRNSIINKVQEKFNDIIKNNIKIILVPGAREIPLYFSNDIVATNLLKDNESIFVVFPLEKENTNLINPISSIKINEEFIDIYGIPEFLKGSKMYNFNYQLSKNHINLFCLPDPHSYKNQMNELLDDLLLKIKKFTFDGLIVGGNIPDLLLDSKLPYPIIHSPQIHPNVFKYKNCPHGIKFIHIDGGTKEVKEEKVVPISTLELRYQEFNLEEISPKDWSNRIKDYIKNESQLKVLLKIVLKGEIDKKYYQNNLDIFKYSKMGHNRNFYFEMDDLIGFLNRVHDNISEENFIQNELRGYVQHKINGFEEDGISQDAINDEIILYNLALEKIEKDRNN